MKKTIARGIVLFVLLGTLLFFGNIVGMGIVSPLSISNVPIVSTLIGSAMILVFCIVVFVGVALFAWAWETAFQ